jgi:hypothetical protein
MCASCSDHAAPFSSTSGPALLQEAADSKISVQSACSLNTVYKRILYGLFSFLHWIVGCRDSSVGMVMGYRLEGRGSIPRKGNSFLSTQSVQTGSGANPASYPTCARWLFLRE